LADCAYDPITNYFSRSNLKYALPYILAYRFWAFQVNPDILKRYSGLKDFDFELKTLEKSDPVVHKELKNFYQLLQDHHEKITKEHTKEKVKVVEKASLDDFITNRRASATFDELLIKIPQIGEINLLQAKFTRSKYIYLSGEVDTQHIEKVLKAYSKGDFPTKFTFYIKPENTTYALPLCQIESLSGNPPPIIKIKITGLLIKMPEDNSDDLNNTIFPATPVSKNIDSKIIKKEVNEELKTFNSFKEVETTLNADNSVCIRVKNHK
jgi:hypothetical protein